MAEDKIRYYLLLNNRTHGITFYPEAITVDCGHIGAQIATNMIQLDLYFIGWDIGSGDHLKI